MSEQTEYRVTWYAEDLNTEYAAGNGRAEWVEIGPHTVDGFVSVEHIREWMRQCSGTMRNFRITAVESRPVGSWSPDLAAALGVHYGPGAWSEWEMATRADTYPEPEHPMLSCPYRAGTGDRKCVSGCYSEPRCITDEPEGGWA
jgi:hypothetical protein